MEKMKIIQTIVIGDSTYIFTENPEQDIKRIQELYQDDERTAYMGYESVSYTHLTLPTIYSV